MRARLASIILTVAVTACGGKSHPPAGPTPPPGDVAAGDPAAAPPVVDDAEFEAHMQAGLAFIDELADGVEAASGDCAKVAAAIEATVARHPDVLASAAQYDRDPLLKAHSQAWLEHHQDELSAAGERIGAGVGPCTEDPAVQAAVQKLSTP